MTPTPKTSIRLPDALKRLAKEKAARQGMTLSHVVRLLLDDWVRRD